MFEQLSKQHRLALAWFSDRKNLEVDWPPPLEGMFLANKAKGIHKPAGLEYALSIRQALDGPYSDNLVRGLNLSWALKYAQEGSNADYFTNLALIACMRDGIPIGVFLQTAKKPNSRYHVLGLGKVINFDNGMFEVRSFECTASTLIAGYESDDFNAKIEVDNRRKTLQALVIRQGQPAFRNSLLEAYGNCCAITNCAVVPVLEAAHIVGYRGAQTNHVKNGLLLRADLHILFDLGLLNVDPEFYRLHLDEALKDTEYWSLNGKKIRLPSNKSHWPSRGALETRRLNFKNF